MSKFIIADLESGVRVDSFLVEQLPYISRTKIQKLIKEKLILVNNMPVKANLLLREGDIVDVLAVDVAAGDSLKKNNADDESLLVAKIEKIYECDDYLVINKPAGILVHPGETSNDLSIVELLWDEIGEDLKVESQVRPGVVHRLDKDTSGILILAKTKKGYDFFVDLFKKRKIEKHYLSLVFGVPNYKESWIDSPIGRSFSDRKKMAVVNEGEGKEALTKYKVLEKFKSANLEFSLLDVKIETGRTHQIRVHMSAIGHSVVGDGVYGTSSLNVKMKRDFGLERQFLHAYKLKFKDLNGENKVFELKLPEDLQLFLDSLDKI